MAYKTTSKDLNKIACLQVDKMRGKKCNLSVLPRFLRPYFKTRLTGDLLTLCSKQTGKAVRISFKEEINGTFFFDVYSSKILSGSQMTITANTNKELLTKIIYRYELFN